jgi:hypothetical protein
MSQLSDLQKSVIITSVSDFKLAHSCQKKSNLHTKRIEYNVFFLTSPLQAPIRLKSLKLA